MSYPLYLVKVEAESHGKHLRHKILVTTTGNEQLEADFVNRHGWVPLNDLVAQNASLVGSLEPRSGKNSDLMQVRCTMNPVRDPDLESDGSSFGVMRVRTRIHKKAKL